VLPDSVTQVLGIGLPSSGRPELRHHLERGGFEVLETESVEDALHIMSRRKIACVLAVADGPEGESPDLVSRILRSEPGMALVVLARSPEVGRAVACMRLGASDYLPETAAAADIAAAVNEAVRLRRASLKGLLAAQSLREEVGRVTGELRREQSRGDKVALAALESLVHVVEAKDLWLAGHSVRVAQMAASLAAELGHTDEEVEQIRLAGRLHDIGMVGVSEGILSKQGPLTPEEFEQVRAHVTLGSQILSPLPGLGPVVSFVRHHHERHDGQGYPDRLSGEAVPWGARVIGVAEIYDAFTTSRPYREPLPPELAVAHMKDLVGTAVGLAEWRALGAVVARREALVFVIDDRTQAAPGARGAALHL
jgi:putative two-component system response regulator